MNKTGKLKNKIRVSEFQYLEKVDAARVEMKQNEQEKKVSKTIVKDETQKNKENICLFKLSIKAS